jgi:anti-sigma factor RsiW
MISDPWTARLSDYLDGELSDAERRALERHLGACPACTAALAGLVHVIERARALPDRPPAADLWSGVAARIAEAPSPAAPRAVQSRRWAFSLPQLAAAVLAVAFTSGGAAWLLARYTSPGPAAPVATAPAPALAAPAVLPAGLAGARYDAAVADLERVLAEDRGRLDSTTVRIIEQNLAVIDRAIADARRALAADPGNPYLSTYLAHTMRRKMDLLRQAATIAASRS